MSIQLNLKPESERKPKYTDPATLGFGKVFTDHMFLGQWKTGQGWYDCQIKPYEPFVLDPSSLVFHYGQEIFEGLKAYQWHDGSVALFRPEMNAKRFNASAERLCMPHVPEALFLDALDCLVGIERGWIPKAPGTSLYIRPAMIAVEAALGVKASSHYYFFIIASPVGPYYPAGFHPITVWVEDHYVRACRGGIGEAKTGGNYACGLKASVEAKAKGYDQVLWLDGASRTFVEEAGATNMFFVYEDKIVTASLDGAILHGITRDSILTVARSLQFGAEEKKIAIGQIFEEIRAGVVREAFCSGTAAVITPVGSLAYKNEVLAVGNGKTGAVTRQLYEILTGIQYGTTPDPFGWTKKIPALNKSLI